MPKSIVSSDTARVNEPPADISLDVPGELSRIHLKRVYGVCIEQLPYAHEHTLRCTILNYRESVPEDSYNASAEYFCCTPNQLHMRVIKTIWNGHTNMAKQG